MGFGHLVEVASLPQLMLLLTVFSLLISPAALARSRHHERAADCLGLELT
jgi:Zn-dependent protease with chaperone function